MTQSNSTITINDANADEAYARVLPEAEALKAESLVTINLDVAAAIITAMGVAEKLPGLQQDQQSSATLAAANAAKFPDYVLALFSAQSRYTLSTAPEPLPELLTEAAHWRDILIADAKALVVRGLLSGDILNDLTGTHGYKNVAFDLAGLSSMFRGSWSSLQGNTALTLSQLQEADKVALKLAAALAHREQSPEQAAEATDIRQRMYTLFYNTYDELRRAVIYLRWHESDAASIIPSLYAGRGNSNIAHKNNGDPKPQPVTAPTTPVTDKPTPATQATQTTQPAQPTQSTQPAQTAPTPVVANVPVGHLGGDPLTHG